MRRRLNCGDRGSDDGIKFAAFAHATITQIAIEFQLIASEPRTLLQYIGWFIYNSKDRTFLSNIHHHHRRHGETSSDVDADGGAADGDDTVCRREPELASRLRPAGEGRYALKLLFSQQTKVSEHPDWPPAPTCAQNDQDNCTTCEQDKTRKEHTVTGEQVRPMGMPMGPSTMPSRPRRMLTTGSLDDSTLVQHSSEPVVHCELLWGIGVATARRPKEARTASFLNCMAGVSECLECRRPDWRNNAWMAVLLYVEEAWHGPRTCHNQLSLIIDQHPAITGQAMTWKENASRMTKKRAPRWLVGRTGHRETADGPSLLGSWCGVDGTSAGSRGHHPTRPIQAKVNLCKSVVYCGQRMLAVVREEGKKRNDLHVVLHKHPEWGCACKTWAGDLLRLVFAHLDPTVFS